MTITLGENGSANQLRADLASTASEVLGDALVGVEQTWGPQARTQHDVNEDVIRVVGQGSTTNISGLLNTAIASAIANKKSVELVGDIYLTSQVVVDTTAASSGVFKITGKGGRIFIPAGSTAAFNTTSGFDIAGRNTGGVFLVKTPNDDGHNVVIESLYFYKNNQSDSPYTGTWINFQKQRNLTVQDCAFEGAGTHILATEAYGLRVTRNAFTGFETCIWLRGAANTTVIRDNSFRNGRRVLNASSNIGTSTSVGIKIEGNYFESTTLYAIYFQGVRSSVVANNYFEAVDQALSYGGVACPIVLDAGVFPNAETSSRNLFYGNFFSGTMYVWAISGTYNIFVGNTGLAFAGSADKNFWYELGTDGTYTARIISESSSGAGIGGTGVFTQETPTTVSVYSNSWVAGPSNGTAKYWKDRFGVVHLEGGISGGTIGSTTQAFTLPSGYRPPNGYYVPAMAIDGTVGQCYIKTTGEVNIRLGTAGQEFALQGITYRGV